MGIDFFTKKIHHCLIKFPRGSTLIFSFFGVFKKINIFWGMKILWIFLGSSQNWTILTGNLWPFLELGYFFGVAKISNILLGCLKFLIFLWVKGRC